MDDMVELGLEGADKLVDLHFHKIPDKALQPETYNPRNLRKKHRRRRRKEPSSDSESESNQSQAQNQYQPPPPNMDGAPQYTTPQYSSYSTAGPYSQRPPSLRPEYAPSPPPIGGQPYYPPPPRQAIENRRGSRYDDEDSDDDGYYSDRKSRSGAAGAMTRRSSSYHGPRGNDDYYNDRAVVPRRRGSHDDSEISRSRDGGNHNFKDEAGKYFTKSPIGITGAVGGALVGGWAAKKAQEARGNGKRHGETNALITLLGAAAGGLIANAAVDQFEERKKKTAKREIAWEEKFGSGDESDDSRDSRGRRDRSRSRRRRSRSHSNDRYGR